MVVDTSAILCVLLGEAGNDRYIDRLASAERCVMAAPTWFECAIVTTARLGPRGFELMEALLAGALVYVHPFDSELARLANAAWLQFGKGRHPAALNFGDCFSYALAKSRDEPLLFKGQDFSLTDIRPVLPECH
jgi:ribonuclease VapC